jgi:hypothetical protein
MMTQPNTTADHKGEVRPSANTDEQLEDKIADEKNEQIGDESAPHGLTRKKPPISGDAP